MIRGACVKFLERYALGKVDDVKYVTPMIWRKATNAEDCYFCSTIFSRKNKFSNFDVTYKQVSSVDRPVLKDKNKHTYMEIDEASKEKDKRERLKNYEEEKDEEEKDEELIEEDEYEEEEPTVDCEEYAPMQKIDKNPKWD